MTASQPTETPKLFYAFRRMLGGLKATAVSEASGNCATCNRGWDKSTKSTKGAGTAVVVEEEHKIRALFIRSLKTAAASSARRILNSSIHNTTLERIQSTVATESKSLVVHRYAVNSRKGRRRRCKRSCLNCNGAVSLICN